MASKKTDRLPNAVDQKVKTAHKMLDYKDGNLSVPAFYKQAELKGAIEDNKSSIKKHHEHKIESLIGGKK